MNIIDRLPILFWSLNNYLEPLVEDMLIFLGIIFFVILIFYIIAVWKHNRDSKKTKKIKVKWKKEIKKFSNGEKQIEEIEIEENNKIFRNLIIESRNVEEISLEDLKKIYQHYGFLDEDKKLLKSKKWWRKAQAIKRLKDLEFESLEDQVYQLIYHDRFETRLAAIDFLGSLNSTWIYDKISDIFKENRKEVDQYLILKLFPSDFPVEGLKDLVFSESIRDRKAAAILLGKYKNYEALDLLEELVDDPEEDIRIEAIKSLGRIGTPLTVPAITSKINDDKKMVRAEIAKSLGRIKDPNSLYLLRQLVDDPEYVVRVRAFTSISRFGELGREIIEEFRDEHPVSTDEAMLRSFFFEVEGK